MSADPIYITGTRHPGSALLRFLPDYLDTLLHQGHPLITTHKKGVDEAIITHCDQHHLPLQVFAFHTNDGAHPGIASLQPDLAAVSPDGVGCTPDGVLAFGQITRSAVVHPHQ